MSTCLEREEFVFARSCLSESNTKHKKTYGLLKSSRTTSAAIAVPTRVVVRRVEKICILGIEECLCLSIFFVCPVVVFLQLASVPVQKCIDVLREFEIVWRGETCTISFDL